MSKVIPDPDKLKRGIYFYFLVYVIQHCFICRPSDSSVSEDAGIEPDKWVGCWK